MARDSTGDPRHKSWVPGRKGQGGEGLSDGYGGSAGDGTGASGPDMKEPLKPRDEQESDPPSQSKYAMSPSLPSPERIAQILR
jgi:hypothetical protein